MTADKVDRRRARLRAQVWELDRGTCCWPMSPECPLERCGQPAVELAHFHSVGMGGRASADEVQNAGAMCARHARCSDLQPPEGGGRAELWAELLRLPYMPEGLTAPEGLVGQRALGWWVAEALTVAVAEQRTAAGWQL